MVEEKILKETESVQCLRSRLGTDTLQFHAFYYLRQVSRQAQIQGVGK